MESFQQAANKRVQPSAASLKAGSHRATENIPKLGLLQSTVSTAEL